MNQVNDTLTKTGIIAIVDDDEPLREALGSVMKAAGFRPTPSPQRKNSSIPPAGEIRRA